MGQRERRLEAADDTRRPVLEQAPDEDEDDSDGQEADEEGFSNDYGGDVQSSFNPQGKSRTWTYEDLLAHNKHLENLIRSIQEDKRNLENQIHSLQKQNQSRKLVAECLVEDLRDRQRVSKDENQELRKQLREAQQSPTGTGETLANTRRTSESSPFCPKATKD